MVYRLGKFALEELEERDLELARKWRNSAHVKKWMITDDTITPEGQKRWFRERRNRSDFVFTFNKKKIGMLYFSNKNPAHRYCEIGFYIGEKEYLRRGLGAVMEFMGLDIVFNEWKYNRITGSILPGYKRIINMHKRFGFKHEGVLRRHILKKNKYWDVIIQGILREEWLARRDDIYKALQRIYKF